jgi:F-type H+-transporting ATPase subunit gamma
MANTKEISRRIKSVSNTKKITRAMEMVAAAKMRRAIEAVLKTRTYANLSWETILHLAKMENNANHLHHLIGARPQIKQAVIILITSNRGLCGGYNSTIISQAKAFAKNLGLPVDFILIGKKGGVLYRSGQNVAAEFIKSDVLDNIEEIHPIIKLAMSDYAAKKYDQVFVAYTDFVSAVKQVPRIKQLLPIDLSKDDSLGVVGDNKQVGSNKNYIEDKTKKHLTEGRDSYDYTFEPSPKEVLDKLVPRLLEIQLFQAVLESNASEYSSAMAAMHQATEAADDMVEDLTLFFNKARQAIITNEIAEISAGANALAD